jgi:hypothetical protein
MARTHSKNGRYVPLGIMEYRGYIYGLEEVLGRWPSEDEEFSDEEMSDDEMEDLEESE